MQPMPDMPMQQQDGRTAGPERCGGMVHGAGMGGMAQSGMVHDDVVQPMEHARSSK